MQQKLADLWLEFSAKGAGEVKNHLDHLKGGVAAVAQMAQTGFGVATVFLGGWVTAGLAGTVQGDQLAYSTGQLAREIASVFLPAVERVTDFVRDLTDWFRSLSDDQQDTYARWSLWTLAGLGIMAVLPKIIRLTVGLIGVVKAITAAIAAGYFFAGPLGWLKAAVGAGVAVAAVAAISRLLPEGGRAGGAAGRRSVQLSGGGPESIEQTYQRIQSAALRTGSERNYEQETADNFQKIRSTVEDKTRVVTAWDVKRFGAISVIGGGIALAAAQNPAAPAAAVAAPAPSKGKRPFHKGTPAQEVPGFFTLLAEAARSSRMFGGKEVGEEFEK